MGYNPGRTARVRIAVTPDGKGYVILFADGNILKFGSAATGAIGAAWATRRGRVPTPPARSR